MHASATHSRSLSSVCPTSIIQILSNETPRRLIVYSSSAEDGKLEENLINSISADTLPPCLITRIDAVVGK